MVNVNIRCNQKNLFSKVYLIERVLLPHATKLGQGNIFSSVCQEFCPRGGSTWAGIPPMVNERAVRILLECILVK